ncbi:mechanosensitive ion channel family protein [Roseofilum sp. BLCC_M154]|uniref:Mechanosensitive ion channel family protein n=1 Tax=Roseofilum acuticapitatum BLCC-M154 TaxID=3022444 RepID=A0ABT7ATF3_9CYAN|nr:mechanosensitive ion channel family protein [Roseofilum acuticapitatum]MDJ1170193.1 mechanosensitive ion channel family protein [Roseofilum acuticapitatum BLCC-M154]
MKTARFIGIFSLAVGLILTIQPTAIAQLPFLTQQPITIPEHNTPWWDLNKAQPCGRYWCSEVHLYSTKVLTGELKLAVQSDLESERSDEAIIKVEQRAKLVQSSINRGINATTQNYEFPHSSDDKNWTFWWFWNQNKPKHPLTPRLAVGINNNETVVYAPPQPQLGIFRSATVVTITDVDSRANFTSIEKLGEIWSANLELAFSEILWGKEFDAKYPWIRSKIAFLIMILSFTIFVLLYSAREKLTTWRRKLKDQIKTLIKSLEVDAQENSGETLEKEADTSSIQLSDLPSESSANTINLSHRPKINKKKLKKIHLRFKYFFRLNPLKVSRQKLSSQIFFIQQTQNLIELFRRIFLILQPSVLLVSLALTFGLFRTTRFLTFAFIVQAILLPTLWISITIIDKFCDIIIDSTLNKWAKEKQEIDPSSNRYTLRVTTYSPAIKQGKHALFSALGIYITMNLLGVNINVLASVGVLTVVLAFISRNLLEDMLNGILILWTDRYAQGDFVEINNFSGTVEMINLYVTHLRNLDGQLIIIPNGQVSTVINSTKDWSRSNLTIKIALGADLKKAMEIIKQVSNELEQDEEWKDKILEPVNILGVDDISHEGTIIRFLIKTVPGEQWAVSRTFRLRIKKSLDEAGIALGIPQQIWCTTPTGSYIPKSEDRLEPPSSVDKDTKFG